VLAEEFEEGGLAGAEVPLDGDYWGTSLKVCSRANLRIENHLYKC
jgi:hypothetical protein